jgi:thiamine-phosphate pyrophosphorylase
MIHKGNLKTNFLLLGSAHSIDQIKLKEKQGVDIIFLSPLFFTKDKKNILGISKFNLLANQTKKKIVALGGINENNIKKLNLINCYGFASISLIQNSYSKIRSIIKKY